MSENVKEIKAAVDDICRMAMLIPVEDAVALVNEFNRMHSLMPLIDPTGYRDISGNIGGHEDAARYFLAFRANLAEALK